MLQPLANLVSFVLCGLVGLQVLIYLGKTMRRGMAERRANRQRIARMNDEILALCSRHPHRDRSQPGWEGLRKFRVDRKVAECDGVHSFYLIPSDGKSLPPYQPGQFLTFQLPIPAQSKPIVRCYSLSDAPGKTYYRCSIKQVSPPADQGGLPAGVASSYFQHVVNEGDILDVRSPRGGFHLDVNDTRPIVLVAGGIGITPMAAMMNTLAMQGSQRSATLFYGVRNSREHILRLELAALCQTNSNLNQCVCYSSPLPTDRRGGDFDVHGRISVDIIHQQLGQNECDFYLCGPGPFMKSLVDGLRAAGVPEQRIHTEAFGPSAVKKNKPNLPPPTGGTTANVTFGRSDKTANWDPDCESLLDFAEAQCIEIESGCRAGNCGTCATPVKSGKVHYAEEPSGECPPGSCLPCVCVPGGSIVLEA